MTVKFKCRKPGCFYKVELPQTNRPRCEVCGWTMVKAQLDAKAPAAGSKYNNLGGRNNA
jgi:rRNA maturation endonuclease Nob1